MYRYSLSTYEIPRRLANLGERRTFAKLCGRLGLGWVVLRIVVWRKDRFRWPVNRRRDSIAPKKSVYGAKLTRRGGVSWPGDKAARCPWRSRHRVLPIILYPRLVPVAYIFYFLSALLSSSPRTFGSLRLRRLFCRRRKSVESELTRLKFGRFTYMLCEVI